MVAEIDSVKVYGKSDPDTQAEDFLRSNLQGKTVRYIILNQRVPINARPCQLPDSLTVQAVLEDGSVVSVRQNRKGSQPFLI